MLLKRDVRCESASIHGVNVVNLISERLLLLLDEFEEAAAGATEAEAFIECVRRCVLVGQSAIIRAAIVGIAPGMGRGSTPRAAT